MVLDNITKIAFLSGAWDMVDFLGASDIHGREFQTKASKRLRYFKQIRKYKNK